MEKMTAEQIKKAIIENKTSQRQKPIEPAELLGVKGFLFRSSSYQMEGWRELSSDKDPARRRLGPAKLVQISFRAEDGTEVFEELDLPVIAGIDDEQINPIVRRVLAVNGYGNEGAEEILKNLIAICGVDGVYDSLASINAPCPNCTKDTQPTSCKSSTPASDTGR